MVYTTEASLVPREVNDRAPFLAPDFQFVSDELAISRPAVEARHASYLNLLTGESPFPDAFDTALSRDDVLSAAGGFFC